MAIVSPKPPRRQDSAPVSVDRRSKLCAAVDSLLGLKARLDAEDRQASAGAATDGAAADPVPGYLVSAEPAPEFRAPKTSDRPAPAEPVKATRSERGRIKRAAADELSKASARARELTRWRERWEANGGDPMRRPPLITREQWGTCRAIVHSPKAAHAALQWLARHFGGAVAARVYDAAFSGGRWDLSDVTARKFVAMVVFFFQHARLTTWGRTRDGRLQLGLCVRGVPRGALCAMLADPHTHRPISLSTLSGWSDRWAGYLARGSETLVFEPVQVPAEVAEPWEIGPSGYTMNRYWLSSSRLNKPALDLSHLDTAVEHERGWQAVFGDGPQRAPRRRQLPADEQATPE